MLACADDVTPNSAAAATQHASVAGRMPSFASGPTRLAIACERHSSTNSAQPTAIAMPNMCVATTARRVNGMR